MDNQIISALIGIIGALLGAWSGSAISRNASMKAVNSSNQNAIDISCRQEFNKAASSFRCAFTEEIRRVEESTVETDFIEMFNSAYVRHYNAIIQFLPYINEAERIEIKNAWENHCYPKGLDEYDRRLPSAKFIHYDHHQGIEKKDGKLAISEEHEVSFERAKSLVGNHLNTILSFANLK